MDASCPGAYAGATRPTAPAHLAQPPAQVPRRQPTPGPAVQRPQRWEGRTGCSRRVFHMVTALRRWRARAWVQACGREAAPNRFARHTRPRTPCTAGFAARFLHELRRKRQPMQRSVRYSTSTIASISTVIPKGRLPTPIADRACFAPNTCSNRSEHPLITRECSRKSGTALTMPSSLITRLARSRSPSSPFRIARMLSPTRRACSAASSVDTSSPTFPFGIVPSGLAGTVPER